LESILEKGMQMDEGLMSEETLSMLACQYLEEEWKWENLLDKQCDPMMDME
jgi:hypothetical protein